MTINEDEAKLIREATTEARKSSPEELTDDEQRNVTDRRENDIQALINSLNGITKQIMVPKVETKLKGILSQEISSKQKEILIKNLCDFLNFDENYDSNKIRQYILSYDKNPDKILNDFAQYFYEVLSDVITVEFVKAIKGQKTDLQNIMNEIIEQKRKVLCGK